MEKFSQSSQGERSLRASYASDLSGSSVGERPRFLSFTSSNNDAGYVWYRGGFLGSLLGSSRGGSRASGESYVSDYDLDNRGGLPTRDELREGGLYTVEEGSGSERSSTGHNDEVLNNVVANSRDAPYIQDDLRDNTSEQTSRKKPLTYNKTYLAAFVLLSCSVQAFLMIARVSECEKDDLKSFHRFSSCITKMNAGQALLFSFNTLVAYIVNCLSSFYFFKIPTIIIFNIIIKQLPQAKKSFVHVLTALVLSVMSLSCYPAYDYLLTKEDELGFNEIKTMVALFCANNRVMISLYGFFLGLPPRRSFEVIQTITSARELLAYPDSTPYTYRREGKILGFTLSVFVSFSLLNINENPAKPWGLIPFYLFAVLLISVQAGGDVISNVRAIGENIVMQWKKGEAGSSLFILAVALLCTWGAYVLADDLFNIIVINDDFHDFYRLPALVLQRLMHASTTLITFSGATNSLAWFFDAKMGRIPPLREGASRQSEPALTASNLRANLLSENGDVPRYDVSVTKYPSTANKF
jgi:hypothetical protein